MLFNINKEQSTEGNIKVVPNIGKPGIYKMRVSGMEEGAKFKGKDAGNVPALNIIFDIVQAIDVPRVDNPQALVGKKHVDVIDLSLQDQTKTQEEMFNNKLARIKHILKKADITPEAIDAAIEPVLKKMKEWDAVAFMKPIIGLLTDAGKKKTAYGKVTGSVVSGNPNCNFSGFLGFYTEEEPTFTNKERQQINEYYAALEGQTPSGEGQTSNGGSSNNNAF